MAANSKLFNPVGVDDINIKEVFATFPACFWCTTWWWVAYYNSTGSGGLGSFVILQGNKLSQIPKTLEERRRFLVPEDCISSSSSLAVTHLISLPREDVMRQFGRSTNETARNLNGNHKNFPLNNPFTQMGRTFHVSNLSWYYFLFYRVVAKTKLRQEKVEWCVREWLWLEWRSK